MAQKRSPIPVTFPAKSTTKQFNQVQLFIILSQQRDRTHFPVIVFFQQRLSLSERHALNKCVLTNFPKRMSLNRRKNNLVSKGPSTCTSVLRYF